MINAGGIKEVAAALSVLTGIPVIRAEQNGERPKTMFCSYKITQAEDEPAYRNIVRRTPVISNPAQVTETVTKKSHGTVSFNFFSKASEYADLCEAAQAASDWFDTEDGAALCAAYDIFPAAESRVIQDRSAYLETEYESRLGFDVRFTGFRDVVSVRDVVDIAKTIESIEEV